MNASNNTPRLPLILPSDSEMLSDLPPQYDQLEIIRPPTYQEAIQKG
jgi:hypothetical protein